MVELFDDYFEFFAINGKKIEEYKYEVNYSQMKQMKEIGIECCNLVIRREDVEKYGILIIVLTAVTPIPYKLLAIWLGFIGYPMLLFLGVSAIFRTGRFAIIGGMLYYFQEQANTIVKKYFWPLTFGAIIAAGLGIFLISLF